MIYSSQCTILPFTESHVPEMAALAVETYQSSWSAAAFTALHHHPAQFGFVHCGPTGLVNGYVIGQYIPGCDDHGAGEGEIFSIAVKTTFQRQGIGLALLRDFDHMVMMKGGGTLFLEVKETNHGAKSLYQQHGFVSYGVRQHYYTGDVAQNACLMKKTLKNVKKNLK